MSFWHGKSVLVTGGTGFIGSHLVERLLDAGASVRVIGRCKKRLFDRIGHKADEVDFVASAGITLIRALCSQKMLFSDYICWMLPPNRKWNGIYA